MVLDEYLPCQLVHQNANNKMNQYLLITLFAFFSLQFVLPSCLQTFKLFIYNRSSVSTGTQLQYTGSLKDAAMFPVNHPNKDPKKKRHTRRANEAGPVIKHRK